MAVTSAALQTALGSLMTSPRVLQELAPYGGSLQHWLISGGVTYPGRVKKIATTASDNAATQATTITDSLKNGVA